ncbi:MAG: 1,4-alpha-glucan branching protein GlgB [Verrucomicrobiota bacterium]|nr:1,4-alpha-glucan branching protein GlgB [Verrucomicrobiota bacterium]
MSLKYSLPKSWPKSVLPESLLWGKLQNGMLADPHSILGMHKLNKSSLVVRCFAPNVQKVEFIDVRNDSSCAMQPVDEHGMYVLYVENENDLFPYKLKQTFQGGEYANYDPYNFLPEIGELDLYYFSGGKHHGIYDKLGAHKRILGEVTGVAFLLWAPNAARVSVVGDFNNWDGLRHPMRNMGESGIWELFIPGLTEGDLYKFELKAHNGDVFTKLDPYASRTELRPKTSGIIHDFRKYKWADQDWMKKRQTKNILEEPMSVYEIHLGSWQHPLLKEKDEHGYYNYREIAPILAEYAVEMGYTHIELLPIMEHPLDQSWGYQVTAYFAPTARFGTPDDFAYFVDVMHQHNIGVILDWVPAHFPKDEFALGRFDGTALYEHADPRKGEHEDWGTYIFNYGRNEVKNFLIGNALYWFDIFHLDGLRVDAVASMIYLDYSRNEGEWIPNKYGGNENLEAIDFLKELNELVHADYPGAMMIAEESTAFAGVSRPVYLGGLGFTLKWNMGWMHDTLSYFTKDAVYRKYHHDNLTFSLLYAFTENFTLPFSHDEVVHGKGSMLGKMSGDYWQKFANLRALYAFMYAHPGKKLLFMGGEFAQWKEWEDTNPLEWFLLEDPFHSAVQLLTKDLNRLYKKIPALYEQDFTNSGFEWVDVNDVGQSVFSFIRWDKSRKTPILVVANMTPIVRKNYTLGVPVSGKWEEILNTDSSLYEGSNVGNNGGVMTKNTPSHSHPYSLKLTLPPLGVVYFKIK